MCIGIHPTLFALFFLQVNSYPMVYTRLNPVPCVTRTLVHGGSLTWASSPFALVRHPNKATCILLSPYLPVTGKDQQDDIIVSYRLRKSVRPSQAKSVLGGK